MEPTKIKLRWFCKHGQCNGSIELSSSPASITLQDIQRRVKASHAETCKIGGEPWVLVDLEPKHGGMCVASKSAVTFGISDPMECEWIFVVLHVQ